MANSKAARGALLSGEKTVTAAGTAEALGTGFFRSVTITAKVGNTNNVYIGGIDVASTTNDGLASGDTLTMSTMAHTLDLARIFIDADTNGEGVDIYAIVG
jgi:hypothetical protein